MLLAGTGIMCCGEKEEVPSTPSLLEGTILEDTYVITDSGSDFCYFDERGIFSIDIVSQVPISAYLTSEDLLKSEFAEEDLVEIIQRARDGSSTDTNVTTEEKGAEYTK